MVKVKYSYEVNTICVKQIYIYICIYPESGHTVLLTVCEVTVVVNNKLRLASGQHCLLFCGVYVLLLVVK